MIKIKSLIVLLSASLTLTGCGMTGEEGTEALGAGNLAPGSPIRWQTAVVSSTGIDLRVSQDFINDFVPGDNDGSGHHPMEQMAKVWNDADPSHTFFRVPMTATPNRNLASLSSYFDGEQGIYRSTTWFPDVSSSALAVTQFFGFLMNPGTSAEHLRLTHADIIFNYRDHSFSTNASSTSTFDLHTVVLHEMGHFLGLPHQNNFSIPAVMQPFLSRFDSYRTLFTDDETAIRNNYAANLLTGVSNAVASFSTSGSDSSEEPELVRGIVELHDDGSCKHYINGKLIHEHKK